jgi:hypothetical protein
MTPEQDFRMACDALDALSHFDDEPLRVVADALLERGALRLPPVDGRRVRFERGRKIVALFNRVELLESAREWCERMSPDFIDGGWRLEGPPRMGTP